MYLYATFYVTSNPHVTNIIMVNTKSTVQYNLPNCNGFMTAIYFSNFHTLLCTMKYRLSLITV